MSKNDAINKKFKYNRLKRSVIMSFNQNERFANNLDHINVLCKFLIM